MSTNRVDQSDISTGGGDVAGGNINKPQISIALPNRKSPLASIIARYEEEIKSGTSFDQIIEKLQHWHDPNPNTEVIGVKEKLLRGNRQDLVDFALRAKELFTKCVSRHQHSKAAQEIFAYILAMIWTKFNSVIRPRIIEGHSNYDIDILIQSELIAPIEEMLDINPLSIDQSEISGMIYFLTGNCHLTWQ